MPTISRTLAPHDSVGLGRSLAAIVTASEGRSDFQMEIDQLCNVSRLDIVVAERLRQERGEFVDVSGLTHDDATMSCGIANEGDPINQRVPAAEDPPITLCAANSVSADVSFDTNHKRIKFLGVDGLQIRTRVGGTLLLANIEQVDVDLSSNKIDVTFSL